MMSHGRILEVDSRDTFDALVAAGATSMRAWRVQDVDLTARTEALARLDGAGAVLLGCDLEPAAAERLRADGAILFDDVPNTPFNAYRTTLYTPAELLDAPRYDASMDARIYAWSRSSERDIARTLASALHDHAIDDALEEWCEGRRIVGVMGGHALARGSAGYLEAARLGRALAGSGLTVATGGGPGAMEAANLGARSAGLPSAAFEEALAIVARQPGFAGAMDAWVARGLEAAQRLTPPTETLGVPTWHYGHEPPNALQTASAKYFANAVREDILLRVATAGIVVLPGAAGTVQEIFQDACENYYADASSWAPLVLVGREHWQSTLPAWPLLESLMRGRPGEAGIALVDDVDAAVERILDRPALD